MTQVADGHRRNIASLSPIDAVIGAYLDLTVREGHLPRGVCPFHRDQRPQPLLNVRASHGTFHCFGCGQGGDVFTFISLIERTTYDAAVRLLAARAKYHLP
jgi:DNA primase